MPPSPAGFLPRAEHRAHGWLTKADSAAGGEVDGGPPLVSDVLSYHPVSFSVSAYEHRRLMF